MQKLLFRAVPVLLAISLISFIWVLRSDASTTPHRVQAVANSTVPDSLPVVTSNESPVPATSPAPDAAIGASVPIAAVVPAADTATGKTPTPSTVAPRATLASKPAATSTSSTPMKKAVSKPATTPLSMSTRVLEKAGAEVGRTGTYAAGGFWCAKFASWAYTSAAVPHFQYEETPSALHADALEAGRISTTPVVGGFVFIDLFGPDGIGHGQVSHVGIVESINGNEIHTIEGNADESNKVTRKVRHIGDGYVLDFANLPLQ